MTKTPNLKSSVLTENSLNSDLYYKQDLTVWSCVQRKASLKVFSLDSDFFE